MDAMGEPWVTITVTSWLWALTPVRVMGWLGPIHPGSVPSRFSVAILMESIRLPPMFYAALGTTVLSMADVTVAPCANLAA